MSYPVQKPNPKQSVKASVNFSGATATSPCIKCANPSRIQGALGAILPFQFFQWLFVRFLLQSLIHPERPERAIAANWLVHPLRKHFPSLFCKPSALHHKPPEFINCGTKPMTSLLEADLLTATSAVQHRVIYQHLISSTFQKGRTGIARPDLD